MKNSKNLRLGTLVEVLWFDIASYGGWQGDDRRWKTANIRTMGYIARRPDDCLYVAQSCEKNEEDGTISVGNVMVIPVKNVNSIRVMK